MTHLLTGSDQEFEESAQYWATNDRSYHKNAFGQTALHLAVIFPKRLKRFLQLGMSPDVLDLGDTTPLMYAAAYGQSECVLELIDRDSGIYSQDALNKRYFSDYAVVHGHVDLITELVRWLREHGDSEFALAVLSRSIQMTFAQCSVSSDSDTLDCFFQLYGDSDVLIGSKTSMHLARNVDDARVVLRNKFTAVGVVDDKGETALMRVSRLLDTHLLRDMLKIEADAGVSLDRQDFSGWTALMHLTSCIHERNSYVPEETLQLRRSSAVGCLNMLLSRRACSTLTDSCSCPCSPNGCSALSIALHRAVESIGPFDSSTSISRTPLDFAIALQTCTDDRPQWAIDNIKTFVDFLETGELHTCCARRRVRSGPWVPPSDCATSSNARTHARLATSAEEEPLGGLPFQLARLYNALQRRSQAQHDTSLAEKAKRHPINTGKRRSSGLIVDKVHDRYEHATVVDIAISPVLRLDMDAYRQWIAWCVAKNRKLNSRRSLEAWARESSAFVDRLEESLVGLAQRR
jgi:ankyrin repeat protein